MSELPGRRNESDADSEVREHAYRRFISDKRLDLFHDLIVKSRLAILDSPVPYVLASLKNRQAELAKRANRQILLDPGILETKAALVFDPSDAIAADSTLATLLASIPIEESSLLWWAASGFSSREQLVLWERAGFLPSEPTEAYLRKRISLARRNLRNRASQMVEEVDTASHL
jgi:hypothetical protein